MTRAWSSHDLDRTSKYECRWHTPHKFNTIFDYNHCRKMCQCTHSIRVRFDRFRYIIKTILSFPYLHSCCSCSIPKLNVVIIEFATFSGLTIRMSRSSLMRSGSSLFATSSSDMPLNRLCFFRGFLTPVPEDEDSVLTEGKLIFFFWSGMTSSSAMTRRSSSSLSKELDWLLLAVPKGFIVPRSGLLKKLRVKNYF